jgi:AraC family transcriptional regulator
MTHEWEILLPLLVHMQANLEGDLSLAALAAKSGLSPFHLHRVFQSAIGESPKAYAQRLHLERAAFRMLVHESTLLDIALDCGFRNPETFSRAFRNRYGRSPRAYRQWIRTQAQPPTDPTPAIDTSCFEISSTKVVRMRPMHLAFIRHVGPYELVPDSLFDTLEAWRAKQKLTGPPVWLGIGHDSPVATPPDKLRFDAALEVPAPFAPAGSIAYQLLPAGDFAVTTHAGPYATLPQAYAGIFPRLTALPHHQILGLPAVEIYLTTRVNASRLLNHTDICLPVRRITSA